MPPPVSPAPPVADSLMGHGSGALVDFEKLKAAVLQARAELDAEARKHYLPLTKRSKARIEPFEKAVENAEAEWIQAGQSLEELAPPPAQKPSGRLRSGRERSGSQEPGRNPNAQPHSKVIKEKLEGIPEAAAENSTPLMIEEAAVDNPATQPPHKVVEEKLEAIPEAAAENSAPSTIKEGAVDKPTAHSPSKVVEKKTRGPPQGSKNSNPSIVVGPAVFPTDRAQQEKIAKDQQKEAEARERQERHQRQQEDQRHQDFEKADQGFEISEKQPDRPSTDQGAGGTELAGSRKRELEGMGDIEAEQQVKRLKIIDTKIEEGQLHLIQGDDGNKDQSDQHQSDTDQPIAKVPESIFPDRRFISATPLSISERAKALPIDPQANLNEKPMYQIRIGPNDAALHTKWLSARSAKLSVKPAQTPMDEFTIISAHFGRGDAPDDPDDGDVVLPALEEEDSDSEIDAAITDNSSSSESSSSSSETSSSGSDSDSLSSDSDSSDADAASESGQLGAKTGLQTRGGVVATSTSIYGKWLLRRKQSQEKLREKGQREVSNRFLDQKNRRFGKPLSLHIRGLIREVPDFCPEGASTTYTIAKECHLSLNDNYVCGYHAQNRGPGQHQKNGDEKARWTIMGQPFPYNVGPKQQLKPNYLAGYFHCGCPEADVLLEFYLWKSCLLEQYVGVVETEGEWTFTGDAPEKEELGSVSFTGSRQGEDFQDVYQWGRTEVQHKRRLLKLRIERNLKALHESQELADADDNNVWAEVPEFDMDDPLLAYDPDDSRRPAPEFMS
ncbi:hypothetical protein MVEN_01383100 [Mycena venus]|uniref:Uncharacterized protein n=1 Tax=Mycena venus TaxID=2733690 RepID=A0A8H6XYF5_9AGAR|nr:hypothetical protein MVEN_01383100 [Mycena venus]